jgi:hypothetical protein
MGKPIVGFSLDDELLKDIDESKSYLPPNCGSASRSELIRTLIVRGLNTLERPAKEYDLKDMMGDQSWAASKTRLITCPVCNGEYLHLMKVEEDTGSPSNKRHSTKLRFHGECGHDIQIDCFQHKGSTFMQVERFADWEEFGKIAE